MEASSSTPQQNSPQGNTNDQVSDDEKENSQNSGQGNINDQVSVDVNALKLSLTEEFRQLHPIPISGHRCVYRASKRLRVLNENAYTPQCVSIGPYHHGKDELKAMEKHKTMYLRHFLRFSEKSLEKSLEECLETFLLWVGQKETKLRNCYQERIDLSSERFVRLMLVDAAFVIMVMLRRRARQFHNEVVSQPSSPVHMFCDEDDLLFNKPKMILDIRNDMILLKNQFPFFILKNFFRLSNMVNFFHQSFSVVKLSSEFLDNEFSSWAVNPFEELNFSECLHLVDFLRIRQQPLEQNMHKVLKVVNLPSVVKLHQAGVKFEVRNEPNLRLVDINFDDGTLKISLLTIEDSTKILFRNFQTFEQSHYYNDKKYINDYITMINLLIRNEKDVEILTKKGIIENLLWGNEQVVHLFHNLGKGNDIDTNKFYFTDVVNNLNKHYNKRGNRWCAILKQDYFHNPWALISFIAATFVILLTIIQATCSILQVKQHN